MNCREVLLKISAYDDGELDSLANEAVRSHLESCAACECELRSLEALSGGLRTAMADMESGFDLVASVVTVIPERKPTVRGRHRWAWAVGLVGVGVVAMILLQHGVHDSRKVNTRVQVETPKIPIQKVPRPAQTQMPMEEVAPRRVSPRPLCTQSVLARAKRHAPIMVASQPIKYLQRVPVSASVSADENGMRKIVLCMNGITVVSTKKVNARRHPLVDHPESIDRPPIRTVKLPLTPVIDQADGG